jgi:HEAT repeat protein
MRAREAVPALAEALDDANRGHVLTAVRGLGRLGLPHAAVPMLDRVIAGQLGSVPAMPIQDALLGCCRGSPQLLVPYVHRATPETRPLLSRVLGELATGELDPDELIMLTCDEQAEVRASAARALPTAPLNVALAGLGALAESDEWFVRLRAVAGLGQLQHPRAIPLLVEGLCDLNRFVRLRSAAGLARFDAHLEEILDLVEEKKDRYAMQALLSELESSGAILKHVDCLGSRGDTRERAERVLQRSLHLGAHRLLVSMLRAHRSRRVRFSLARLLAASGTPALVPLLERAHTDESSRRQQAVIAWVLGQIQAAAKSAGKRRRKAGLRAVPTA